MSYDRKAAQSKRDPRQKMVHRSRHRAKKKGIDHNIEKEDLTMPKYCPILGILLDYTSSKQNKRSPSIDRIDSSKGYIKGNVIVCSWRANNIKKDANIFELEKILEYMKRETM